METLVWLALCLAVPIGLAYRRTDLATSTLVLGALLVIYTAVGATGAVFKALLWIGYAALASLSAEGWRRGQVTRRLIDVYRRMLPSMSRTEQEALEAGGIWWDGELFSGIPDWRKLLSLPAPRLTPEEQAFLDGPTEELCRLLDDWQITHELLDMPPEIWRFLKERKFFAMIIPKEYGGLGFSALACSMVLTKVSSRNATASSTIGVPNSLGPAELLLHYGTDEQKQYWLPRLASGEEVPCFALTSPRVGSDATAIVDHGVVAKGTYEGREIVGIRLTWDKRYITLAPIATVLGLAFKLYDPEHLIGDVEEYGITAALIPVKLPGVEIGRRHFPINIPFQNGPTRGRDVFVPLDAIIGGAKMAGQGWRMLVQQLAVGRSIVLPSNALGAAMAAVYSTGAYARLRRQFGLPIGKFHGVGEALARMAGNVYTMAAASRVTCTAIANGEKPAVPSAILKYHNTELGRQIANDAMDVHGGKAIMLGPKNYMARNYESVPIAITVEGANILTRSMIIYGQGAIRGHPYLLREISAVAETDERRALAAF
ncbi:MAG TPA: acyl-CoA dehydrogenase, partial [Gammaproteobacteria bacterium]|nr:acyl-CoA dehydrogenase [Gammaproteobacteria bacterium]